ncbi:hypothetical protein [Hymenobacter terrenus]|uniref:hypothetical protein n=1 Tax=Hymenobacter terrenus TaxID=1629124 RepID=UPI000619A5B9|nr:hypothetical protein [Hymenobacter terrenus]
MQLSLDNLNSIMLLILTIMQVSMMVPMVVMWWRKRHFSKPVQLLSWYGYLSAGSVALAGLYPMYLPNNYGVIVGFNLGKIALFGLVYYYGIGARWARRLVLVASVITVAGAIGVIGYDIKTTISISRVAQCAVLAGVALLYLEQTLGRSGVAPISISRDPLSLLSVGQLLYSASSVTAFSLEHLSKTIYDQTFK